MGKPTKTAILKKLKTVAGFKELNNKQIMTRLASLGQDSVKNALKAAKFKGGAVGVALTVLGMGAKAISSMDQKSVPKKGPMRLSGRGVAPKKMTDKEKIADLEQKLDIANTVGKVQDERAKAKDKSLADSVRENTNTRRGTNMKVPPKRVSKDVPGVTKSLRPKARPKSNAPKTSLRPKLRPKEKMMYGGMATKKKMMYGGMAKKPKAKK